jgi:hypothetical protein
MPLFRPDRLAAEGLLDARLVPALDALRARNALLFDLAFKRHVPAGGARLQPVVFSTRRFWQRQHNPRATERGNE